MTHPENETGDGKHRIATNEMDALGWVVRQWQSMPELHGILKAARRYAKNSVDKDGDSLALIEQIREAAKKNEDLPSQLLVQHAVLVAIVESVWTKSQALNRKIEDVLKKRGR